MKNLLMFISRFTFINTRLVPIFLVIILLAIGANAQSRRLNDGSTPLGIAPGSPAGAFSLSDLDTINPYNGNLNFRLPLTNIGGRGSSGYTVTLPINYRWSVFHHYEQLDTFRHYPTVYRPDYAMRPNYRAGNFEVRDTREFDCTPYGDGIIRTLTTIVFTAADGTEYEFRSEAFDGSPRGAGCSGGPPASRGTIWKTSDGSFLTFVSDMAISDMNSGATHNLYGYLMFPDGTKYRVEAGRIVWIRDRNGNVTTFTYSGTYTNSPLVKVTDSIGREITFAYDVQDSGQYGLHDQITYKGFGGQTRTIRISYKSLSEVLRSDQTIQTYQALFPNLDHVGISPPHNPTNQIAAVWLPNGQAYRFYYNSFNELARVELPTGGAYEYDWGASYPYSWTSSGIVYVDGRNGSFPEIYRQVLTKRIYPDGGTGNTFALKTIFNTTQGTQGSATSSRTIEQRDASNHLLGQTKHYFHGHPIPSYESNIDFKPAWNEGREYQTETFDIVNGIPVLKRRVNQTWQKGAGIGYNEGNARVIETLTTLVDTNQVSKTTSVNPIDGSIGYDQFNNQTDIYEYDYDVGAAGAFKRRTHTDYVTDTNYISYTGLHLRSLPLQTWISSDVAGDNKGSLTQIEYDVYTGANNTLLLDRANVIGHDTTNYGSGNVFRGNVTKVTTYGNAQNQTDPIEVYSHYDILGNVVENIDANGNHSTINYNDNFGSPDAETRVSSAPAEINGQNTFAFSTSATNTLGWITGYSQFDYYTGQPVDAENLNGVVNSTFYNDPLDRPTQAITANNLDAFKRQTKIIYVDANNRIETKADLNAFNDNLLRSESFYDGFGQQTEVKQYKSDGSYVVVMLVPFSIVQDPETSKWHIASKASNPFRPQLGETPVWTTSMSNSLGNVIKIITPDGAKIKTEYLGSSVTSIDQSGKKIRNVFNGIGQLKEVHEPNNLGELGSVDNPFQSSKYTYDVLNNLIRVEQAGNNTEQCGQVSSCSQIREFQFDSLSRLRQSITPESGTNAYNYDNNGNLIQRTDARGVITNYTYDPLNRITNKTYSAPEGLPNYKSSFPVNYFYDNLPNAKGKLTKILTGNSSNPISITEYSFFDEIGRIQQSRQSTDGMVFNPIDHVYNLSGALVEQKYPSGRVVKSTMDDDGDLLNVQSKKIETAGFIKYAKNFRYAADGMITSMQLGNGLWESVVFNNRSQPTEIALGSLQNGTDKLKLNFIYNSQNAIDNNGNLRTQAISVPASTVNGVNYNGFTAIQHFTYDSLNRVKQAKENFEGQSSLNWQQTFKYDRYGNRELEYSNDPANPQTTTPSMQSSLPKIVNPKTNPNTNRLLEHQDGDSVLDYKYDLAGNLVRDAQNRIYTYDSENMQVKVEASNSNDTATTVIAEYIYDGNGKRIKKIAFDTEESTVFVYDVGGRLIAEYSNLVVNQADAKVAYLTTDQLGSTRITTDALGKTSARYDFYPFGEKISRNNYITDNTKNKFTGYKRDFETGHDFAGARMYSSVSGRFNTPDPLEVISLTLPQIWNKYSYVMNNPINLTDSSGKCPDGTCWWQQVYVRIYDGPGLIPYPSQNIKDYVLKNPGGSGEITASGGVAGWGGGLGIQFDSNGIYPLTQVTAGTEGTIVDGNLTTPEHNFKPSANITIMGSSSPITPGTSNVFSANLSVFAVQSQDGFSGDVSSQSYGGSVFPPAWGSGGYTLSRQTVYSVPYLSDAMARLRYVSATMNYNQQFIGCRVCKPESRIPNSSLFKPTNLKFMTPNSLTNYLGLNMFSYGEFSNTIYARDLGMVNVYADGSQSYRGSLNDFDYRR